MKNFSFVESSFLWGMLNLEDGVSLLKPKAAAEKLGYSTSAIEPLCQQGLLPHIWDGESLWIFFDERSEGGRGGKYSLPPHVECNPLVGTWKNRLKWSQESIF